MATNQLSKFRICIRLTLGLFVLIAVAFGVYVYFEKQIDRANELRQKSFLLADELRQSSDDLTRMVRSYVITGDPIYKKHYQEILDIREGLKPRPIAYHDIYWDLVLADDQRPRGFESAVALLEVMRQAKFTAEEFSKLAQAKANADALSRTEFAAINLLEATNPPSEANRIKASRILHDADYHHAKYVIMLSISEFQQMMDQRTLNAVQGMEKDAMVVRVLVILLGLLILFLLNYDYRILLITLGGPLDNIHERITRLGSGDFSAHIPVAKGLENSIMGWLSETQSKLNLLDAEGKTEKAKNQRMTQLYAALSHCNQAIVRGVNQEDLFQQICRVAVTYGGMVMAWIGLTDEETKRVIPVASYGRGTDYLDGIYISVDENEDSGQGPCGNAMRQDKPFWCQDYQHDPVTTPWHERGKSFGWGSSAGLPLHRNGKVVGVFNLYAHEVGAFDEAARNLLIEMVLDIDYALSNFDREKQRKLADAALATSNQLLKTIIDTAPVRIFWKDKDLCYLGCNPAFAKDAGLLSPDAVVGKSDYQLGWKALADNYNDDKLVMATGVSRLFYEEPQTTPDGKTIILRTSKVPLQNAAKEIIGLLGIYEDITEQKQAEERIHYLANFDSLTGLPNRTRLNDHLKYALSLAKRSNGSLTLMFLDLDHFKDINDTLGHNIGDSLLVAVAKRLCLVLREEDTVTRLGGDEFILLLPGVNTLGAAYVAQKLLDILVAPIQIEGYDLALTASIGIALYPADGMDLNTLSKSADTAMYQAKKDGRHGYCFFTPEMQARSVRNLQVVNALRQAIEKEQLFLHYQPQIAMQTGLIIGSEALLRWRHPELGVVSPSEFIPIAEDSGLILSIGEWVLRSAVRQAKKWLSEGHEALIMAVNLSAVQFRHPDLPSLVTRILAEEGLPPEYLELELTEGVAMHNPQGAIAVMNNLHERGVRMSIDDFGTGYSSLSYLKKFKVYKLKIDQSFVRDISIDAEDRAIVKGIISLAQSLGLKTIAEGVETVEQMQFLLEQGCDEIQGYLFSKPVSAEQFLELPRKGFII